MNHARPTSNQSQIKQTRATSADVGLQIAGAERAGAEITGTLGSRRVRAPLAIVGAVGLALLSLLTTDRRATAQMQVTTGVPFHGAGDSFSENISVGGMLNGPGFSFRWGTMNGPIGNAPGPGMPAGGMSGGFGFGGNGLSGAFGFSASQSSQRDMSTTMPVVTGIPGYPSYFGHGTLQPFVIGVVPVVGTPQLSPQFPSLGPQVPWQQQLYGPVPSTLPRALHARLPQQDHGAMPDDMPLEAPGALGGDRIVGARGDEDVVPGPPMPAAAPVAAAAPTGNPSGNVSGNASGKSEADLSLTSQVRAAANGPLMSLAEIEAIRQQQASEAEAEVRRQMALGDEAFAQNELGVAEIYYRAALRRTSPGPLRNEINERLQRAIANKKQPKR